MRIRDMYTSEKPGFSFEVYPPKTAKGLETLYAAVADLNEYDPVFISGTYGAGGSTQGKTLEMLREIRRRHDTPVTAHFTVVDNTLHGIRDWLSQASHAGMQNIMALRGDPPQGETRFVPTPGGLQYACELVALIRREFPHFGIGVAGYPECHREAPSPEADLLHLKHKVDAGADAVFTQLFFDNSDFLRFRDRCERLRIQVPIVPGILPVLSLLQVQRITSLCASRLPDRLWERLKAHESDTQAQIQVGVEHAIGQCQGLLREGVPGIHFYVLNRSDTLRSILEAL